MQIKNPKAQALSVLTQVGNKKMLNKSLFFPVRHSGFLPLPPGEGKGIGVVTVLLMLNLFIPVYADTPQGPNLGQPASKKEIVQWDIGIMPDGEGLPKGSGTAKQGRSVYEIHCVSCHGPEGSGGTADQLAGAKMALTSEYPEQTIGTYWPYATTLFDMTRRSMPMQNSGTLSNDEVYAVTAYLLYLNKIIGENDVMNSKSLPKVKMPNRDGFINEYLDLRGRTNVTD